MKRTALAPILSEILLFLAISGILVLKTAANPVAYYEIPIEPDKNPPIVTVNSAMENQTFYSQNVTLSFTVTKPETWIKPSTGKFVNGSDIYYVLGNITSFYCVIDHVESQSTLVQDISTVYLANPQRTLSFSINLTLTEGHHTLYIGVKGETKYRNNTGSFEPLLSNMVQGTSQVVNFTIAESYLHPEPSPTTLVIAASVTIAVIGLCLLAYFKKFHRN